MGKQMKLRRINAEQEPAHVRNKKKRRLYRILTAIKVTLVTAFFAITIVYASLSPFFNINEIVSYSSAHYDETILTAASGIRTGRNGFRLIYGSSLFSGILRIGDAESRILINCPYVKEAKVRYVLPSTIRIEVTEREPAAVLDMKGTKMLIDREGYLLELEPAVKDKKLPVIKATQLAAADPGSKLDIPDEILLSAFKVFDTIREVDSMNEDKLLSDVDYVDATDSFNIRFSLDSRITVNLGKAEELHYKINAAASIIKKNIKQSERGTLDFSKDSDPVFTPENGG